MADKQKEPESDKQKEPEPDTKKNEPEWVQSYRAFNDSLHRKLESESGQVWAPRERVALLRRVRAIASGCATKEAILVALDEMIDAMGYGEPSS